MPPATAPSYYNTMFMSNLFVFFGHEVLRVNVRQVVHKEDGEDALRERLPGMPFHLYAKKTKRFDMNMEL